MLPLAFGLGGPQDLVIVAVVVLLLFGGSKLAGFGKSLGEGIKEFKKATKDEDEPTMSGSAPIVADNAAGHPAPNQRCFYPDRYVADDKKRGLNRYHRRQHVAEFQGQAGL